MSFLDYFKKSKPALIVTPDVSATVETRDFGQTDAYSDSIGWTSLMGGPYGASHTGIQVNPINAMACGAFYATIRVLIGDVAKLPLRLMKYDNDIWVEVKQGESPKTDYLVRLMHRPNKRMTPNDFKTHIAMSLLLVGNSYNVILRDDAGRPTDVIPCIPSTVSMTENGEGDLFYTITNRLFPKFVDNRIIEEDCVHVRAMSLDGGIRGASIVQLASEVLGIGMATQQLVAEMFNHGTNMKGYLSTDTTGIPKEMIEQLREQWQATQSGMHNTGKTPALQAGFQYHTVDGNAEAWQLVEARQQIIREIAMVMGVPLYKLSSMEKSSYTAIDAQQQDYIDGTLIPLINPIEEELNRKLLFEDQIGKYKFEFDFSALEKGDLKTRSDFVHQMLTDGVFSVNEVRKEFNLPGIGESGDIRTKPLNVGTIGYTSGMPMFQVQGPLKETETETVPETNVVKPHESIEKPV